MIEVFKEDYIVWKVDTPTKHLLEYLKERRRDLSDTISLGNYVGIEIEREIGNVQNLALIIEYIEKDFEYIEKGDEVNDKGSGV